MKVKTKIAIAGAIAFAVATAMVSAYLFLLYYYQDPRVASESALESRLSLVYIDKFPVSCVGNGEITEAWAEWKSAWSNKDIFRVCIKSNTPISRISINGVERYQYSNDSKKKEFLYSLYLDANASDVEITVFFE